MTTKSPKANQATYSKSNDAEETNFIILDTATWDIKKNICGVAKANRSGQGRSASLTYDGQRFFLKIPSMPCVFDAGKPKPKPGESSKPSDSWSAQLAFTDRKVVQDFLQKAIEFDQFMIDEGTKVDNCVGWLGASKTKPYSREVVESKYIPFVKYSKKDGEILTQYPPSIRIAFPTTYKKPEDPKPAKFTCEFYDKNDELIDVSPEESKDNCINKIITRECMCSALLSGSIWCSNAFGYGVTWKVAQIKILPPKGKIPKGKCLVSDPVEEESDEEKEETKNETDEDVEEEEEETIEDGDNVEVVKESTPTSSQKAPISQKVGTKK